MRAYLKGRTAEACPSIDAALDHRYYAIPSSTAYTPILSIVSAAAPFIRGVLAQCSFSPLLSFLLLLLLLCCIRDVKLTFKEIGSVSSLCYDISNSTCSSS
jgi:hypothetical protein